MASITSTIIKQGYLLKEGRIRRSWRHRWFILCPNVLFYYKSDRDVNMAGLLGTINITSHTKFNTSTIKPFGFEINVTHRVLRCVATCDIERQSWLSALYQCIGDHETTDLRHLTIEAAAIMSPLKTDMKPTNVDDNNDNDGDGDGDDDNDDSYAGCNSYDDDDVELTLYGLIDNATNFKIKKGYMYKLGEVRKNWKRRWFVCVNRILLYSKSENDCKMLGRINLDAPGCSIRVSSTVYEGHSCIFEIVTSKRIYIIDASDMDSVHEWMSFLSEGVLVLNGVNDDQDNEEDIF